VYIKDKFDIHVYFLVATTVVSSCRNLEENIEYMYVKQFLNMKDHQHMW